MWSLIERLNKLEQDLLADPPRISAYHDLPFAIFHYPPTEEFKMRKEIKLLATRLTNNGKRVHIISLARLLWRIIEETEGIDSIINVEKKLGFSRAQEMVTSLISDEDFMPISQEIAKYLKDKDPSVNVCFLVRVGVLGPSIYRSSTILNELHSYRVRIPTVLFYPGTSQGERDLRFLGLANNEMSGTYNYRVKIY